MSEQKIIIGGADQTQLTRKAMEDAAADARHLMANSPIIPKLVAVDIISRQLFMIIRGGLDGEIRGGWEVEQPELVIQTLGMSAQEKAVNTPFTAVQLRDALLTTVLPVVDAFCQMEAERNEEATQSSDSVPRDDHRPSA